MSIIVCLATFLIPEWLTNTSKEEKKGVHKKRKLEVM